MQSSEDDTGLWDYGITGLLHSMLCAPRPQSSVASERVRLNQKPGDQCMNTCLRTDTIQKTSSEGSANELRDSTIDSLRADATEQEQQQGQGMGAYMRIRAHMRVRLRRICLYQVSAMDSN